MEVQGKLRDRNGTDMSSKLRIQSLATFFLWGECACARACVCACVRNQLACSSLGRLLFLLISVFLSCLPVVLCVGLRPHRLSPCYVSMSVDATLRQPC